MRFRHPHDLVRYSIRLLLISIAWLAHCQLSLYDPGLKHPLHCLIAHNLLLSQYRAQSLSWPGRCPVGLEGADQEAALFADLLLCERLHDLVSLIPVIIM